MKRKENLYVDIHVLQTVPPSCVNRDDTGSPKTCIYGGVRRSRVSSQSWKRAVRVAFRDMYAPEDLANRTKHVIEMVEDQIKSLSDTDKSEKLAIAALNSAGIKINETKKITDALFFMSQAQAKALAEVAVAAGDVKSLDKAACKAALQKNPSIDLALFGRMVASDPSLNYDAAAMVAHSISTHKVQSEFDYFTAVDDCSPEDTSGAGHLGTVEYNSSTLYRYASVNVRELSDYLVEATPKAVRDFVDAFLLSMPTGKITTFANRTLPDAVYITVRKDQPVNMAPAFEKPVLMDEDGGYVIGSENALVKYADSVYSAFVSSPDKTWTIGNGLEELGQKVNLKEMLDAIETYLTESLSEVE